MGSCGLLTVRVTLASEGALTAQAAVGQDNLILEEHVVAVVVLLHGG